MENGQPLQPNPIAGAILGCAVGDALGLPYEGLSRQRAARILGAPDRYRFLLGRGMVSDDTEHTCMVAQAYCVSPTDANLFARNLAWRFRWWLLGVPAGVGFATLRALLRLWSGYPPARSGVFSAGNGPAMRSAVLGAAIDDLDTLQAFVAASTIITHTDPKAFEGAWAVALAAWCAKRGQDNPAEYFTRLRNGGNYVFSTEFLALMAQVETSLHRAESTETFADQLGCSKGVSGYVYSTVPVAIHAWLSHAHDFKDAVESAIACGGDSDTMAAIVGALVGTAVGLEGIPDHLVAGLLEYPRSISWMERLADAMASAASANKAVQPPKAVPVAGLLRNVLFLWVVLAHGFRRMLPPY